MDRALGVSLLNIPFKLTVLDHWKDSYKKNKKSCQECQDADLLLFPNILVSPQCKVGTYLHFLYDLFAKRANLGWHLDGHVLAALIPEHRKA